MRAPGLILPGSGIYFWWQAGATSALARRYDLGRRAQFAGASGGALAATLAACDCDTKSAFDVAWRLCEDAGVFSRGAWGLYGVWGGIVETWLDELLPADADARCTERVNIMLRRPLRSPELVGAFASRADLIAACRASTHIPFFMDRRFSVAFRDKRYIDSEFLSLRKSSRRLALPSDAPSVRLSVGHDARVREAQRGWGSSMRLMSRDGLLQMIEWGEEHVDRMEAEGELDCLAPLARAAPKA